MHGQSVHLKFSVGMSTLFQELKMHKTMLVIVIDLSWQKCSLFLPFHSIEEILVMFAGLDTLHLILQLTEQFVSQELVLLYTFSFASMTLS